MIMCTYWRVAIQIVDKLDLCILTLKSYKRVQTPTIIVKLFTEDLQYNNMAPLLSLSFPEVKYLKVQKCHLICVILLLVNNIVFLLTKNGTEASKPGKSDRLPWFRIVKCSSGLSRRCQERNYVLCAQTSSVMSLDDCLTCLRPFGVGTSSPHLLHGCTRSRDRVGTCGHSRGACHGFLHLTLI